MTARTWAPAVARDSLTERVWYPCGDPSAASDPADRQPHDAIDPQR